MKRKKVLYYAILAVLIGVFVFSAYKIGSYYYAKWKSSQLTEQVVEEYVQQPETGEEEENTDVCPEVDFAALQEEYPNVVAWIYAPGTVIDYPVLQCEDNDFYLTHLMDGSYNENGSIFMDCANAADFSSGNTLLYGHHMKSGAMFAALMNYKSADYYEAHDHIYIVTPDASYRMDLLCGSVIAADDAIYSTEPSWDAVQALMRKSRFDTKLEMPAEGTKIVTLSTCSYEYDDARFVVLGVLTPIEK